VRAATQKVDTRDRRVPAAAFREMDQAVERVHAAALTVEQEQFEFGVSRADRDRAFDQLELVTCDDGAGAGRARHQS
jgi:hypothetical protein